MRHLQLECVTVWDTEVSLSSEMFKKNLDENLPQMRQNSCPRYKAKSEVLEGLIPGLQFTESPEHKSEAAFITLS